MTPREQFINALTLGPPQGHVPTFELVFFLTMEALGKVFPGHRQFSQWEQMSRRERELQLHDAAQVYIDVARRYGHGAIYVYGFVDVPDSHTLIAEAIRELSGLEFCLLVYGDPTFSIPDGSHMLEFSCRLADDPAGLKREASARVDRALAWSEHYAGKGLWDGFAMCSDYCLNTGPFLSPRQFSEFVAPYLARTIEGYRRQGYCVIKHTDGNIMPILDQLVQCRPHALHSIDPQAGVDIAEVKRLYGNQICLIGNVNCGLLQTGTDEQCIESARYALRNAMPGGGYIFSTSNCVYTGMALERYELILKVWREEGRYGN